MLKVGVAGNAMLCETLGQLFEASSYVSVIRLGTGTEPISGRVIRALRAYRCDLVHAVGFGNPELLIARLSGMPSIRHWIGSDVIAFGRRPMLRERIALHKRVVHACVCESLGLELLSQGIQSQTVALYSLGLESLPLEPLPERPTILTYWRDGAGSFYGERLVMELADAIPEVQWKIAGATTGPKRKNVAYLGWVDLSNEWRRCSAYFRFTEHDGLPKLVLEALGHGRQVLWNQPFPYCMHVTSFDSCLSALRQLLASGGPNLEGRDYVRIAYSTVNLRAAVLRLYETTIDQYGR